MSPRLGAVLAVVLWGASFVATKIALREVSPLTLVVTRFAMGTLVLAALVALRRQALPPRSCWPTLLAMGFLGVTANQLLQASGIARTSAMNAAWLVGLIPIWSVILSALLLRERFGVSKVAGIALGFLGALVVVTRGDLSPHVLRLPSTTGDLLVLASTVTWALYSVVGRGTLARLGAGRATAGAMALGTALLLPLFVAREGWRELPRLSAEGWTSTVFLGVGCSGVAYALWNRALDKVETAKVASLIYLEPLVTVVVAAAVLDEPVRWATVLGGLLVLAGVLVVQRAPQSLPQRPKAP